MLFISRLLIVVSFSVSMFFFSIYLHTEIHVPLRTIGLIMMATALVGAVTMLIGGGLSDRLGRKPIMWISTLLRALVFFAIAYTVKNNPDVRILAGLYIVTRILGSLFLPASDAMLADIIRSKDRTKAYGMMRIFANAGFALGPAIGGIVAEISYAYLFLVSAAMSVVVSLFILFFIKESLVEKKTESTILKDLNVIKNDFKLISFCAVSFAFFVVMGQFGVTLSIFAVDTVGLSKPQFGQIFLINGLMVIFLQYPITLMLDNIRSLRKIQIGTLLYALGFTSFGLAHSFAFMTLSVVIITIGEMIYAPSTNGVVANMAPPDARGRYIGTLGLTRSFGWSIAPLIGGFLLHSFIDQGLILWGIIGVVGLVGVIGYVILEKTTLKNTNY